MVQPSHPTLVMFFMFTCSCLFVFFILICFIHNHQNDENTSIACLVGFTKFMEALLQWKTSENGVENPHGMLPWQITCQVVAIFQHRRRFFRFTPRKGHVFVASCGCFDMLSMSISIGFTQVRQGTKIQKYPWHWRSEHVWTEYLPTPTCHGDAMAKYGNGSNPLTQLIYSAVVIWCRWDSFNLRWRVAAAGGTFNHPWVHNRPSLPIRKHCGLSNTSILCCGTQLKISCCRRTSWWVLHSIKWSMSSHKAKAMARYRLVNRIHVMKSFPNAAQVVNSMSWFQPTEVPRLQKERKTSSGWARLRRRQDSLHIPDENASCLKKMDIPLYQCSCPKVWSQSVASNTWQQTDSSGWLVGILIIPTDPFAVHWVHWCRTC